MGAIFQVKTRLIVAVAVILSFGHALAADPAAEGMSILKSVRIAQTSQHMTLNGALRTGPTTVPLRLVIEGPVIRYEFKDPALSLVLKLGEKGSQLQEVTRT